jgi:hypothetical protein
MNQEPATTSLLLPSAASSAAVQQIILELDRATRAAFSLLHELTASRSEGDEWTRLPRPKLRCPVSHFSRSKVNSLIAADKIRAKTVSGGRYYSLADMRNLIRGQDE